MNTSRRFAIEIPLPEKTYHRSRLEKHLSPPIAGYVIGLGDRHSQNILIDSATAAVVHIDLGIAFEQGRFLNTPELVPFRLTRDIVDGMGVTGKAFPIIIKEILSSTEPDVVDFWRPWKGVN